MVATELSEGVLSRFVSRNGVSDPRRRRSFALALAAVVATLLLRVDSTSADDKTKKIVGGILKILVESQMRGQGGPNQQQLRPGAPRPGVRATPELGRARVSVQSFRQESITLSTLLQKESTTNAGLRSLIADAVQLQARADAISQRSRAVPNHRFHSAGRAETRQRLASVFISASTGSKSLAAVPNVYRAARPVRCRVVRCAFD